MSKKFNSACVENAKKIVIAFNEAVPEGTKTHEVVYALCALLAHIFMDKGKEGAKKEDFISAINEILKYMIDGHNN